MNGKAVNHSFTLSTDPEEGEKLIWQVGGKTGSNLNLIAFLELLRTSTSSKTAELIGHAESFKLKSSNCFEN